MSVLVVNCKKCNKVFQQRLHPICPECLKLADEQFTVLYRRLQASAPEGGIAIDVLSKETGMQQEDIEKLYLEGRLSLAGMYLRMPCLVCNVLCDESERRGRFCLSCSEEAAIQAGVEVKTLRDLDKEDEEAYQQKLREEALLRKRLLSSKNQNSGRFGSMFRH